jgi:anti-sigma factor RsiW
VISGTLACRRHRAALVDFVDRRERGPKTPAALDHLARCERCEQEMAEFALTIVALRRAGRELAAVPVPTGIPYRVPAPPLRRDRWSWRLQAGGLLTCAAIVGLVILPRGMTSIISGDVVEPVSRPTVVTPWRVAESRLAARPDARSVSAIVTVPPRYPDGLTRPWKEVPAIDATQREPEPS